MTEPKAATRKEALKAMREVKQNRKLMNTFLATSAYSSANLAARTRELQRKGAEQWEIDLLTIHYEAQRRKTKKIKQYLESVCKEELSKLEEEEASTKEDSTSTKERGNT